MKLRILIVLIFFAGTALGDTLTLKNGRTITGTYLGGDARTVRMASGDKVLTFRVDEIASLRFGPPELEAGTPLGEPPAAANAASENVIPAGTDLVVRMVDGVDSRVNKTGEYFRANLDQPVVISGATVIPRGADVKLQLVEDKQAGKLTGQTQLTLDMVSVSFQGRTYHVDTEEVTSSSQSRTAQTAKVVGGLGALGAIIGAIAGGGKGAAIGAVSGAGAGTAVQVMTKGPEVKIPSETVLTFTLQRPMRL